MTSYQSISIDLIDATELARPIDNSRVEVLAGMIKARGLQQPIGVAPDEDRFILVFGAHRLAAVKSLGWKEIDARIADDLGENRQRTIDRVMENIGRGELNALERAENLAALKRAYEAFYPEKKRGIAGGKARQGVATAIFALAEKVAETCGLSERSFYLSVSICNGIVPELRTRIHGTELANHQAGLKLLSEQNTNLQEKILHIIGDKKNPANTVADALVCANGERKIPVSEKRMATVQDYMGRMKPAERTAIFQTFEDEVREYAKLKGWF